MKRRLLILGFIFCLSATCVNAISIITNCNLVSINSMTFNVNNVSLIEYVDKDKVTLIHIAGTVKSIPTTYGEFKQIQNAFVNAKNMYNSCLLPQYRGFSYCSLYNPVSIYGPSSNQGPITNQNSSSNSNPNPNPPQPPPTQKVDDPNARLPMFGI